MMASGLRPGFYLVLGDRTEISDYYAYTATDDGKVALATVVDALTLPAKHFAPDSNGIEEPPMHPMGMLD